MPHRIGLIWLSLCAFIFVINAQSQNAIGAYRTFEKTSFSCTGRPAGYYADVETGCQVYHMCDGLGRQFSYSCPNTTLFQQRMLICDHWYMVNCSKAESHYAANLLIGQRDKPFVDDEENNLRTPRPDLLDRPYAPDYSGESFRNQYKQFPAVQNQIGNNGAQKTLDKSSKFLQTEPVQGQTRWKIPPPSRLILPPAYDAQVDEIVDSSTRSSIPVKPKQQTKHNDFNGRANSPSTKAYPQANRKQSFGSTPSSTLKTTTTTTTKRPIVVLPLTTPSNKQKSRPVVFQSAPLHQRPRESVHEEQDDLGTSHSTRYNTSADFNSAESPGKQSQNRKTSTNSANLAIKSPNKKLIKVPSKFYEPPFLYPIYNQDDAPISTSTQKTTTTATTFTTKTTIPPLRSITTTTPRAPTKPTTQAGKPFSSLADAATTATTILPGATTRATTNYVTIPRFQTDKPEYRTPAPAQGFRAPTLQTNLNSTNDQNVEKNLESSPFDYKVPTADHLNLPTKFPNSEDVSKVKSPAKELLPPLKDLVLYDVATTQGPPIYYEWKLPSDALEPPKLDPPIGVDGREYPDTVPDYNSISSKASVPASLPTFGIDQLKPDANSENSYANNPFLGANQNNEASTQKTPASRSIKDTAQPNNLIPKTNSNRSIAATAKRNQKSSTVPPTVSSAGKSSNAVGTPDIGKLREELSVPDYAFPLEAIGRTGYLSSDAYNSFQLKIPERRSDDEVDKLHWFGENPRCPECHPSYVVPGTCEPCFRR